MAQTIRILLSGLILLGMANLSAQAARYHVQDISSNSVNNVEPQISGDHVAWYGRDAIGGVDKEVFLFDGSTTTQLTFNEVEEYDVRIRGDKVAWIGYLPEEEWNRELFLYDQGATIRVTDTDYTLEANPRFSNNNDNLVWEELNGIGYYDGVTTQVLSSNKPYDNQPQASGDNVIWSGGGNGSNNFNIYLSDGANTYLMTNTPYDETNPDIDGDKMVWEAQVDDQDFEIFYREGLTTIQLTNDSYDDFSPQVEGNNVIWLGYDGNDYEIFIFDGSTTTQLTDNDYHDSHAQISGDNIVWQSGSFIQFYDGESISTLGLGEKPQISGDNLTWLGFDGSSRKVMFASPCPIGDGDCDGDVDLDDIIVAVGNFTGPCTVGFDCLGDPSNGGSPFTKLPEDGDTTNPADGDVDLDDVIAMVGAFTGPSSDEAGMVVAAMDGSGLGDPGLPDLIYDPTTGEVFLDASEIGGTLQAYNIKNAGGGILNGNFTAILGGPPATNLSTEIGEFQLSPTTTLPGGTSIGFVFPTGMDQAALEAFVTGGSASPSFGGGSFSWDLIAINFSPPVPEPSSYVMAALGLLGLGFIGWRRKRA